MFVITTQLNDAKHYFVGLDLEKIYWAPEPKWAHPILNKPDAEMVLAKINKPDENRLWPDAAIEESEVYFTDGYAEPWRPEKGFLDGICGVMHFERNNK